MVTGSGRRIGRAIALGLAECGADIVLHYHTSADPTLRLAQEIGLHHVKTWRVQGDLADPKQAGEFFGRARRVAGPIDILINSASIFPADTLAEVTADSIGLNAQINAIAPLTLSRDLAAQGLAGDIINLLDVRVVDYDPNHMSYHLSKRMLHTLTKIMAMEFAPKVKVNAVAPGLVLPPEGKDESYLAGLAHTNPLQRYGTPDDVVDAVLFLLSSTFVTGQVIYVDGGRHLKGAFYGGS
jgi:pteridine reductase